ncbi:hypothetical protein QL285_081753 [Trifolium repens]|nr:hypothetical protein QL285_081753 [Trifolium repens]
MGVSVAVLFSFSLILCHELAHHHRITSSAPQSLFSIKNGKNQASGTSLLCLFEPLFPISGGGFQFQVMKLDQPIVFNFRTNISSGEVLKQKAFKHADSE